MQVAWLLRRGLDGSTRVQTDSVVAGWLIGGGVACAWFDGGGSSCGGGGDADSATPSAGGCDGDGVAARHRPDVGGDRFDCARC